MILIVAYFPKTHFCHYQVFWTLRHASVGPQQRWTGLDPDYNKFCCIWIRSGV